MIIQHNMLAMNNLIVGTQLQKGKAKNMERLASGYRINRAADDAANMAISEKMTSRIRALARCQQNIEEGISLTQTADGALNEVNNMLNRVNELCVQAANDTNTTDDRSKIAAEITQIYDDMDRIFETTEFNTMKIFRHDGDNYYGPEAEYLYHESVTELPPGDLHSWGTGMFPTKQFDLAKGATAATATVTLADGVNLNDATTLDGTSFFIKKGTTTYKVEFGQGSASDSSTIYINTKNKSVQSAFTSLQNNYQISSFVDTITVSGNKVLFTFDVPSQSRNFSYIDETGKTVTASETIANGSLNNNISIYCGNTLNQVDESSSLEAMTLSSTATLDIKILDGPFPPASYNGNLTAFLQNLGCNSLKLFDYNDTIKLGDIPGFYSVQSADDLRSLIATAIDDRSDFSATYNTGTGIISITAEGLSTTGNDHGYLSEQIGKTTDVKTVNTVPISVSVQSSTPSSEAKTVHSFTMPTFVDSEVYSVKIGNSEYLFYDTDTYPNCDVEALNASGYYETGSSSISDRFLTYLRSNYSGYDVKLSGGVVTMTSKQLNDTTSISIQPGDPSIEAKITLRAQKGLGVSSTAYYTKDFHASLDFSSVINNNVVDTSALNGRGFLLNNTYYQFRDANTNTYEKYNNSTKWIDIAGATTEAELVGKINDIITDSGNVSSSISNLAATSDGSGVVTIAGQTKTSSSYKSSINFADGAPKGIFSTTDVSSGGVAQKNPQTEIDFSLYDMDNLDELYGTGFRITCATCPGEFINVMFCHDKSELNYPDSFDYTDDDGNTRTIHNYMVELKDITHGSQIAANIAEQLKDDLDHFTEVKVSDTNPSVLIAQDKRSADQQTGRGQVLAGVYTNFLYNVIPEKLPNLGDKVGGGRKDTDAYYAYCMIYAGDTKEKPYIPVHLPHFSVENLKLEYPKEPWDSYEEITDVMNRSRNAAEVVSMARSKIGADQNRLEHAFDYAANAEEQIAAANSRIEDTDMAEAVTTQAKLTILSNTQEAILSQIVDLPERILPLLQQ